MTYSKRVSAALSYPACKAHASCHLWPVGLYHVFHIISQTVRFSEGRRWEITEHSEKNSKRHYH